MERNKAVYTTLRRGALAALLLALALAGCGGAARPAAPTLGESALVAPESRMLDAAGGPLQPGDTAPDFGYTLPDGAERRLSDLRGKHVLLNFWATWCGPCAAELPALQAAAQARKETLLVLAVNRLETPDTIGAFATQSGVTFPLIANEEGDISARYGARLLPMTYFIHRDGTIGAIVRGPLELEAIDRQLSALR
jgi:peroxiredoxin